MKSTIVFLAALVTASVSMNASAANPSFCSKATSQWVDWVISSQKKLGGDSRSIERLQLTIATDQDFHGVVNRMAARANMLLDKNLTRNEIRADIYGLCMSLT